MAEAARYEFDTDDVTATAISERHRFERHGPKLSLRLTLRLTLRAG